MRLRRLLSGGPVRRAGQPWAIRVLPDEPLLAAVEAPAGRARGRYEATGPVEVMAGGERRGLSAGTGMLEFPVRAPAHGGPGALVELSLLSAGRAAELLILEIARA